VRRFRPTDARRVLGVAVAALIWLVVLKTAGLLISAIVLGPALGLALGGRITGLADSRIRAPIFFALGIGAALLASLAVGPDLQRVAYSFSFWLLVAFALSNLASPGTNLVAAGLLAQALVVTANSGAMPYSAEAATLAGASVQSATALQSALNAESPLPFLADVIPFPFNGRAYSLGDLLIAAGLFRFGLSATVGARNRDRSVLHQPAQGEVAR
jgi:hypothetical protein